MWAERESFPAWAGAMTAVCARTWRRMSRLVRFFTHGDSFGDGLHFDAENGVDDEFHGGAGAVGAEMKIFGGDGFEDGRACWKTLGLPPASRVTVPCSAAGVLPEIATSSA